MNVLQLFYHSINLCSTPSLAFAHCRTSAITRLRFLILQNTQKNKYTSRRTGLSKNQCTQCKLENTTSWSRGRGMSSGMICGIRILKYIVQCTKLTFFVPWPYFFLFRSGFFSRALSRGPLGGIDSVYTTVQCKCTLRPVCSGPPKSRILANSQGQTFRLDTASHLSRKTCRTTVFFIRMNEF